MAKTKPADMEEVVLAEPEQDVDEALTPEEQALKDGAEGPEVPQLKVDKAEGEEPVEAKPLESPEDVKTKGILADLQKEREKRQTIESQLAAMREQTARADERLRTLNEVLAARQQGQEDPNKEPNKEEDPLAWYDWKIRQLEAVAQQQNQYYNLTAQQSAAIRQAQQIQMAETQYAQSNPTYYPAVEKLSTHLNSMFEPMYPDANERQQAIAYWTQVAVQRAYQLGKNPAQLTYEIAKSVGLTEAEAQTVATGVQQAVVAPQPVTRPAVAAPQVRQAAQRASRTLSNMPGTQAPKPISYEDLANMDDDEYEAIRNRMTRSPTEVYLR